MVLYKGYCRPLGEKVDFNVEDVISMNTKRGIKWRVKGKFEDYNISTFCSAEKAQELLSKLPLRMDAEIAYTPPPNTYDAEELLPSFSNATKEAGEIEAEEETIEVHEQIQENTNAHELKLQSEKLPSKYYKKDGSLDMRYTICREFAAKRAESQNAVELEAPYTPVKPERPSDDYGGGGRYRKKPRRPLGAEMGRKEWWEEYRDELEAVDKSSLDDFELMIWNDDILKKHGKAKMMQMIINTLEYSTKLSPQLARIAFKQEEDRGEWEEGMTFEEMYNPNFENYSAESFDAEYFIGKKGYFIGSARERKALGKKMINESQDLKDFGEPDWKYIGMAGKALVNGDFKELRHNMQMLDSTPAYHITNIFGDDFEKVISPKKIKQLHLKLDAESFEAEMGWDGKRVFVVSSVDYETDGEDVDLPQDFTLILDEDDTASLEGSTDMQEIADLLVDNISDETGWLVQGFYFQERMPDGTLVDLDAESFEADVESVVSELRELGMPEIVFGDDEERIKINDELVYKMEAAPMPIRDGIYSQPLFYSGSKHDEFGRYIINPLQHLSPPIWIRTPKGLIKNTRFHRNKILERKIQRRLQEDYGEYTKKNSFECLCGKRFKNDKALKKHQGDKKHPNYHPSHTLFDNELKGPPINSIINPDGITLKEVYLMFPNWDGNYKTWFGKGKKPLQQGFNYFNAESFEAAYTPEQRLDDYTPEQLTTSSAVTGDFFEDSLKYSYGGFQAETEELGETSYAEDVPALQRAEAGMEVEDIEKAYMKKEDQFMTLVVDDATLFRLAPELPAFVEMENTPLAGYTSLKFNFVENPEMEQQILSYAINVVDDKDDKEEEPEFKEGDVRNRLFNVEFDDWAEQEMLTHGKEVSFKEWADEESESHGDEEFMDWAKHEEESHDERYEAEGGRNVSDFEMSNMDRYEIGDEIIALSSALKKIGDWDWRNVKKIGKGIKQGNYERIKNHMADIDLKTRRVLWDKHHNDFFDIFTDEQIRGLAIPWVVKEYQAEITDKDLSELEGELDRKIDSYVKGLNYAQCVACDKKAKVEILEDKDGNPLYHFYSCECGHNDIQDSSYDAETFEAPSDTNPKSSVDVLRATMKKKKQKLTALYEELEQRDMDLKDKHDSDIATYGKMLGDKQLRDRIEMTERKILKQIDSIGNLQAKIDAKFKLSYRDNKVLKDIRSNDPTGNTTSENTYRFDHRFSGSARQRRLLKRKAEESFEAEKFVGRIPKSKSMGEKTEILKNNVRIIFEEAQRPLYPMEVLTLYQQKKEGNKPQHKSKYKSSPRAKKLGITQKKLSQIINSQRGKYYVSRRGLIHYIGERSMQDYIKNLDPKYFAEDETSKMPTDDIILKYLENSHRSIRKYNAPFKYSSRGMAHKFGVNPASMRKKLVKMERTGKLRATQRRCEDAPKENSRNRVKIYYLADKRLMGAEERYDKV